MHKVWGRQDGCTFCEGLLLAILLICLSCSNLLVSMMIRKKVVLFLCTSLVESTKMSGSVWTKVFVMEKNNDCPIVSQQMNYLRIAIFITRRYAANECHQGYVTNWLTNKMLF